LTLHTSIVSMAITVGRDAYSIAWTVHESSLGTSAAQVIQEDGASTLAKECIGMHHSTKSGVACLSASYIAIIAGPESITHCTPGLIPANLYSSPLWNTTTSQPKVTVPANS